MLVFTLLLVSQMIHKSVTNKISKTFICEACQILSADKYEPLWINEPIDKSCGKWKTKESHSCETNCVKKGYILWKSSALLLDDDTQFKPRKKFRFAVTIHQNKQFLTREGVNSKKSCRKILKCCTTMFFNQSKNGFPIDWLGDWENLHRLINSKFLPIFNQLY